MPETQEQFQVRRYDDTRINQTVARDERPIAGHLSPYSFAVPPFFSRDYAAIRARNGLIPHGSSPMPYRTPQIQVHFSISAVALIAALLLCGGTRMFDGLRAASYFLRTRRGPAISIVRLDQQTYFTRDCCHVARSVQ